MWKRLLYIAVPALLAVVGWQQYQIHQLKRRAERMNLEIVKLDRTARDTIRMLSIQNTLNKLYGPLLPGNLTEPMTKLMSDRLDNFDYYAGEEESKQK